MRFWYHSESDSLFMDENHPGAEADELTEAEYHAVKRQREHAVTEEVFDADAITGRYLMVRRAKARHAKDAKLREAVFDAELERLEGVMGSFLDAHKIKSAPSLHGLFYKELVVKPSATDWTAFYKWIRENDAFEFLHKRITAEQIATYMEAHKDDDVSLPPGVAISKEYKVRVRTATGTGDE